MDFPPNFSAADKTKFPSLILQFDLSLAISISSSLTSVDSFSSILLSSFDGVHSGGSPGSNSGSFSKKMEDLRKSQQSNSKDIPKGQLVWSKDDIYSQVINKKEHPGRLRGMGFGYTPTNNGSTSNNGTRFKMTSDEERMQDKKTIRDLQEKLEANNQKLEANSPKLEANNQNMNTMASEMNFLRAQLDFLLRHSGLQLQDGVSGTRDQASPQTHQGSSFASHEIEPCGNRSI